MNCRFCKNPLSSTTQVRVTLGSGLGAPRCVTSDAACCGRVECLKPLEVEFIEVMKRNDPKNSEDSTVSVKGDSEPLLSQLKRAGFNITEEQLQAFPDVHRLCASLRHNISYGDVTEDQRTEMKNYLFMFLYT